MTMLKPSPTTPADDNSPWWLIAAIAVPIVLLLFMVFVLIFLWKKNKAKGDAVVPVRVNRHVSTF